jgi:hypothetical protein
MPSDEVRLHQSEAYAEDLHADSQLLCTHSTSTREVLESNVGVLGPRWRHVHYSTNCSDHGRILSDVLSVTTMTKRYRAT